MPLTIAGKPVTCRQVRHTIKYLRAARAGLTIRDASWLVNVAINRKAGIPDVACRKQESDYQASLYRDAARLMAITRNRVRHYQFETAEIRGRFGHLLSRYDD